MISEQKGRKSMKILKTAAGLGIAAAVLEAGAAGYFYNRVMKRTQVKVERTMKMSGTDWSRYRPLLEERKAFLQAQPQEDVFIRSWDGLRLHAAYLPGREPDRKRIVLCFHGYTGQGTKDYIGLSHYYITRGFQMLLVDERAHGQSEGTYVGFGCMDRLDAERWIDFVLKKLGEDCEIFLQGISMGGATVLMTSGLKLPPQVKGIISDCGFTSAKEVFTHVLQNMYHIPAFPLIQISDFLNKRRAGYGLEQCNAAREVRKAEVPILLIHGDQDTFVPCRMCREIYENCPGKKKMLLIHGAGHAESYYKEEKKYEEALDTFIRECEEE